MRLQHALLAAAAAASASAFNFGGFTLPSLPAGMPTALPTIPALPTALPTNFNLQSLIPSAIVELPSELYESAFPDITAIPNIPITFPAVPSFALESRLPIPTVPSLPSIDISTSLPSVPAIPSEYTGAIRSAIVDINKGLASAGFTTLPTPNIDTVASLRGAIPSIRDQLGDGQENAQKLINSYMNVTQRNFSLPESEAELRDIIERRADFNLSRAEAILDGLGGGQDIHGTIRLVSALVLQNTTQIFSRATQEFTYSAARLREGAEQAYNFSQTQIRLPAGAFDLQNKTLSVIQYASNPYQAVSGQKLNSQVVAIIIADLAGNETTIRNLEQTINFTIPIANYSSEVRVACVYWDTATRAWQTDGCALTALAPTEATCACNHLTDFAIAPIGLVATPSPFIAPLAQSLTASPSAFRSSAAETQSASSRPALVVAAAAPPPETSRTPTTTIIGASLGSITAIVAVALIIANIMHYKTKREAKLLTGITRNPIRRLDV